MWDKLKRWAQELEKDGLALWFCCRHQDMPLLPKILAILVVGYFLSPIDLIPDFIPVLGYLDDLIIVPLGLLLVLRLVPQEVKQSAQQRASSVAERPVSRAMAVVIVATWVALLGVLGLWVWQSVRT